MKINGRAIADEMYENLKERTAKLKDKGITPHLVVILIGNDPASESYVGQKKQWSEFIGAQFSLVHYPNDITLKEVLQKVKALNDNPNVHGIIIQRPVPAHIDKQAIIDAIDPKKDVDGFHPNSPFTVPVAAAAYTVLERIFNFGLYAHGINPKSEKAPKIHEWLTYQNIVVIGRGETAGGPIIQLLEKKGYHPQVISSKTEQPETLIKNADIIISAVGKSDVIKPELLKKNVILLGVGMHKEEDGKLHGDYKSNEIKEIASYYTPVTGGIGPINVAYLLSNLIDAAEKTS